MTCICEIVHLSQRSWTSLIIFPLLTNSLQPIILHQKLALLSLSLFYRSYTGHWFSELSGQTGQLWDTTFNHTSLYYCLSFFQGNVSRHVKRNWTSLTVIVSRVGKLSGLVLAFSFHFLHNRKKYQPLLSVSQDSPLTVRRCCVGEYNTLKK